MNGEILIVDDDSAHLSMLRTVLNGWGYQTGEAEDGADAIAEVREKPFDCILMDVRMANVGGIEALKEIKVINPAIPIIIMTAYSSVDTAVQAAKAYVKWESPGKDWQKRRAAFPYPDKIGYRPGESIFPDRPEMFLMTP